MATAQDVIQSALRKIKVLASGEAPSAEDAADSLEVLNDLMHGFDAEGIEYAHTTLTQSDTINMPDSLIGHLKAVLAVKLAPEFEVEASQQVILDAERGRQFIAAYYLDIEPASVDAGLLNMPSQKRYV